jgi:uncharacterized protein
MNKVRRTNQGLLAVTILAMSLIGCRRPQPELDQRLVTAVQAGKQDDVRDALAAGASSDSIDPVERYSVLQEAVSRPEIVRILLQAGASPSKQDVEGNAPIFAAATVSDPTSMELLLKAGAKPDTRNRDGSTPLLLAADIGSLEVAKVLLKYGADVNAVSKRGMTPLTQAVVAPPFFGADGRIAMVRLLVDHGANLQASGANGKSALDLAMSKRAQAMPGSREVLAIFVDALKSAKKAK